MKRVPKIKAVGYGGKWIGAAVLVGAVAPFVLWIGLDRVVWPLVIAGGAILAAFCVVFAVETRQAEGSVPGYQKNLRETIPFDPEKQIAVIRSSICTGERVAGFKNKADGHFTEVMVLRSPREEQRFKEIYGLETVKTEY